ncbi:hypothetical protein E4V51_27485, partial [Paenibacillus sp. 28ISP30-2]|nr:hypothetical protein [Paenibacillus sp. 28ISP30-2]
MRRDFFPRTVFDRVSAFQIELAEKLSIIFNSDHIVTEWSASIESGIYSPRLDLAIGPFAMDESLECQYDQLLQEPIIMSFLRKLQSAHILNLENNSYFYTPI